MRKRVTRRHTRSPMCEFCFGPLETAATPQNPSATITASSLARCASCVSIRRGPQWGYLLDFDPCMNVRSSLCIFMRSIRVSMPKSVNAITSSLVFP
jgi:hypothetical protein